MTMLKSGRTQLGLLALSLMLASTAAGAADAKAKLGVGLSMTGPLAFLSQQYT
jgi:hypothetical protein